MGKKILAFMMAALMLAVVGVGLVSSDESCATDSQTAPAPSTVRVNYYNGSTWVVDDVVAYDLVKAIDAVDTPSTTESIDYTTDFTIELDKRWEVTAGYSNPNENYGKVTSVNGSTDFKIFVYSKTNSTGAVWNDVTSQSLGWFRPFQDYADQVSFSNGNSAGSANVAIIPGSTVPASLNTLDTVNLTEIDKTNSVFMYKFTIKDVQKTVSVPSNYKVNVFTNGNVFKTTLTAPLLQRGTTIVGYGSDMYLALKDALPDKVVGGDKTFELIQGSGYSYYSYYSWIDTILDKGTDSNTWRGEKDGVSGSFTEYIYWISTINGVETLYTLGYYSNFLDSYNVEGSVQLNFDATEPWFTPDEIPTP